MADMEMVERRIDKDTKAGKGDKKFLHAAGGVQGPAGLAERGQVRPQLPL